MSTTDTEAPFAGKESTTTCPNCGRTLFSGLAEGNVLVCRDAEGNGCQLAVDPDNVEGATMATAPTRVEDITPSPQVGPPNEAPDSAEPPDPDMQVAIETPWEPPVSAPQTANVAVEEPAAASTTPAPPPAAAPPAQQGSTTTGNGGDGSSADDSKS